MRQTSLKFSHGLSKEQASRLTHQLDLTPDLPKVDLELMRIEGSDPWLMIFASAPEIAEALAQNLDGLQQQGELEV